MPADHIFLPPLQKLVILGNYVTRPPHGLPGLVRRDTIGGVVFSQCPAKRENGWHREAGWLVSAEKEAAAYRKGALSVRVRPVEIA
jgi:hypothetical protein